MIDFKLKALKSLANSEVVGAPQSEYLGADAQVYATLHLADQVAALVEQQRIGNVIAFAADSENALDARNGAAIQARESLGL